MIALSPASEDYNVLKSLQPLETVLEKLLDDAKTERENRHNQDISSLDNLSEFYEFIDEYKCLIIFDDFQEISAPEKLSGIYRSEHENYRDFLQTITNTDHKSCFILVSREQSSEMDIEILDNAISSSQCLLLNGSVDISRQVLEKKHVKNSNKDNYSRLIDRYQANPQYLKEISVVINNIFSGEPSDFLDSIQEDELF